VCGANRLVRRPTLVRPTAACRHAFRYEIGWMVVGCDRAYRCLLVLTLLAGSCSGLHVAPFGRPRLEKITELRIAIPRRGALPAPVGRLQWHCIEKGETLLDVARDAGLGFNEIAEANPGVDEWVPKVGTNVLVPTRWIPPQSHQRGLVLNIPEMRLYLFPEQTKPGETVRVRTWAIGIGTEEAPSPVGRFTIRSKDENPTWYVPDSIYRKMDHPRRIVPPGPDNPLGTHRIRLSKGLYAIHGTDNPWAVGRLVTHGCIRLYPEDIGVLYGKVKPGDVGEILYQPVKVGEDGDRIFVEVHGDVYGRIRDMQTEALKVVRAAHVADRVDRALLLRAVRERRGIPVDVTRQPARLTMRP
jgi:L,D-transpeptidase ErfK/SrfK